MEKAELSVKLTSIRNDRAVVKMASLCLIFLGVNDEGKAPPMALKVTPHAGALHCGPQSVCLHRNNTTGVCVSVVVHRKSYR